MKHFYQLLLLSIALFLSSNALAQDSTAIANDTIPSPWKITGSANLSFANVGLSNWAGGGDNSISIGTLLDFKAVRESDKSVWENYFNAAFGLARVGDSDNLFKKTDDQIILGSKYGLKFAPRWSIAANVDLRTQFAPGYTYAIDAQGQEVENLLISNFFSPGYLNFGVGVQYKDKIFSATYSPLTSKNTIVLDDSLSNAGAYGVNPGSKLRSEIGTNLNANLEVTPLENVTFKSNLNLFANYETLGRIDVNWETLIVFKVNKFISASFGTQLIYDHDVLIEQEEGVFERKVQFKHVLNLNFGYKFSF